jgi:sugar lactone lactonase YvrE
LGGCARRPERGGRFTDPVTVPITGDLVYGEGFNANGITRTPDGRALLVVQSNTGWIFRVSTSGVCARWRCPSR